MSSELQEDENYVRGEGAPLGKVSPHFLQKKEQELLYEETVKEMGRQFRFSRVFSVLMLLVELGWVACALVSPSAVTSFEVAAKLSAAVPLGTMAMLIYRQARETQKRAMELRYALLLHDFVMAVSNERARDTALLKLAQELLLQQSPRGAKKRSGGPSGSELARFISGLKP